jgi:putative endopeptidase
MSFVAGEIKLNNSSIMTLRVQTKNSSINIAHANQTGIGLPDRDYYFKSDSSTVAIQNAYKTYLNTLFQLTGTNAAEAKKNADVVYDIDNNLRRRTRQEWNDATFKQITT